ncbi:hypothetical protein KKG41_04530 [Patescibacteria group bacterium]|nr:hypothetical protein [Patescibacteria group bacterium]MBU1889945.1 hypothetical protein [Patescibacteria group bacterium]
MNETPREQPVPSESMESESIGAEKVTSLEELYDLIRSKGEIAGSKKLYTADQIIQKIELVRTRQRAINTIPRTYGIRDAVERLLLTDKVYLDHSTDTER